MEEINEICKTESDEATEVVEMINDFLIDGYNFKHKHQYLYVRSEVKKCEERFVENFVYCNHNIVYIPEQEKEIAIPEHIGIVTTELRSEIAQDTLLYLEQKYSDQIKNRGKAYDESLPLGEHSTSRGHVIHSMGWYKEYLKRQLGDEK